MATSAGWNGTAVELTGVKLHVARAGSGHPVLVLHHDIGTGHLLLGIPPSPEATQALVDFALRALSTSVAPYASTEARSR